MKFCVLENAELFWNVDVFEPPAHERTKDIFSRSVRQEERVGTDGEQNCLCLRNYHQGFPDSSPQFLQNTSSLMNKQWLMFAC